MDDYYVRANRFTYPSGNDKLSSHNIDILKEDGDFEGLLRGAIGHHLLTPAGQRSNRNS